MDGRTVMLLVDYQNVYLRTLGVTIWNSIVGNEFRSQFCQKIRAEFSFSIDLYVVVLTVRRRKCFQAY